MPTELNAPDAGKALYKRAGAAPGVGRVEAVVARPLSARARRRRGQELCLLLLLGAACSGAPAEGPSQATGGAAPTSGGGGAAAGMSGAPSAMAGMSPAAGGAGGGGGGAGGQLGGSAGAPSTAGGGNPGAGGSAGAGGKASDPTADLAAVAMLDGFQLLDPCDLRNYQVTADPAATCPQKDDVKNQHVTLHLAGDSAVTYVVTLHVRGIAERYWYDGGTLDPVSKVFYTGGLPTVGGNASACKNKASSLPFTLPVELTPTDGCFNGFNVFALNVSAPKQHFFLNYTTDKDGDRPPHAVYSHDYTVSVEMQGQATLDFYVIGSDEHQCYNHDKVISGVDLPSSPYIGEFLQFDVVSVSRKGATP